MDKVTYEKVDTPAEGVKKVEPTIWTPKILEIFEFETKEEKELTGVVIEWIVNPASQGPGGIYIYYDMLDLARKTGVVHEPITSWVEHVKGLIEEYYKENKMELKEGQAMAEAKQDLMRFHYVMRAIPGYVDKHWNDFPERVKEGCGWALLQFCLFMLDRVPYETKIAEIAEEHEKVYGGKK